MYACIFACITHTHTRTHSCMHMHTHTHTHACLLTYTYDKLSSVQLYVKLQQCDFRPNSKLRVYIYLKTSTVHLTWTLLRGHWQQETSFPRSATEAPFASVQNWPALSLLFFLSDCGKGSAPQPHSPQTLLQPSKQLWRAGCGPLSKPE